MDPVSGWKPSFDRNPNFEGLSTEMPGMKKCNKNLLLLGESSYELEVAGPAQTRRWQLKHEDSCQWILPAGFISMTSSSWKALIHTYTYT